jgi:hypothetical protein
VGFLPWNWDKAKIFLGDVGSTLLGYTIIILLFYFHNTHIVQNDLDEYYINLSKYENAATVSIGSGGLNDLDKKRLHSTFDNIQRYINNKNVKILDVGCGGGFPGIPLAILFPEVDFFMVDSINSLNFPTTIKILQLSIFETCFNNFTIIGSLLIVCKTFGRSLCILLPEPPAKIITVFIFIYSLYYLIESNNFFYVFVDDHCVL